MDTAIYVRISLDRTGEGLGVARQEEDCREVAARRGWTVREPIYSDNDVSAYSGRRRPGFERLLADIKAGEVQAVVAWHADRLYRRGKDLVRLIDTVQAAQCQVATVTSGDIDLNTPAGRLQARIIGAVSEHESEHKAERERRAFQQAREGGRPHTRGRPYGYTASGWQVIPEQAEIIRQAAVQVLSGLSTYVVAKSLNANSVPSPRGGLWSPESLGGILCHAALSGRVEHKGVIVGPGEWEPILSVEDSDRLRARLSGHRGQKGRRPQTLLTGGMITCGRCGYFMGRTWIRYAWMISCRDRTPGSQGKRCGGCTIREANLHFYVTEAVLQAIDGGALNALLGNSDTEALEELHDLESRLVDLYREYGERRISKVVREAAEAPLMARQKELERRLELSRSRVGLDGLPDPLRPAWPTLSLTQQRAIIKAMTEQIVVMPAVKQGRGSRIADRVRITWRQPSADLE